MGAVIRDATIRWRRCWLGRGGDRGGDERLHRDCWLGRRRARAGAGRPVCQGRSGPRPTTWQDHDLAGAVWHRSRGAGQRDRHLAGHRPYGWQALEGTSAQIAPSTYYAAKSRPASARAVRDGALIEMIEKVHEANYGVYGARKVWHELQRQGETVARCTWNG